jgi:hypothetical protein
MSKAAAVTHVITTRREADDIARNGVRAEKQLQEETT